MTILKREAVTNKHGQSVVVTRTLDSSSPPDDQIMAAVAIVQDAQHKLLVVNTPGRGWEFPGGRREPGETVTQTLRRELLEEACVTIKDIQPLGYIHFEYQDAVSRYTQMFTAVIDELSPFTSEDTSARQFLAVKQFYTLENQSFADESVWLDYIISL